MRKLSWIGLAWLAAGGTAVATTPLTFDATSHVLVIAPHPDDETLAAGGVIRRLIDTRVAVHVAFLTNGDGWDWATRLAIDGRAPSDADFIAMGRRRRQEAQNAAGALGLPLTSLSFLGFPDDGLTPLWGPGWTGKAIPSAHTRAQMVPYSDALTAGAPYTGETLAQGLARVLRTVRPTHVFVSHPNDTNPDHAVAPRFLAVALKSLRGQGVLPPKVRLLTYLVHHPDWPATDPLPGPMVPPTRRQVPATRWLGSALSAEEQAAKARALEQYPSQLVASPGLLRNFLRTTEIFGRLQAKVWNDFATTH